MPVLAETAPLHGTGGNIAAARCVMRSVGMTLHWLPPLGFLTKGHVYTPGVPAVSVKSRYHTYTGSVPGRTSWSLQTRQG
jgi:hypothetical protein